MKIFQMYIENSGASFDENAKAEIVRIIRDVADHIENIDHECGRDLCVRDLNGNICGEFHLERGV